MNEIQVIANEIHRNNKRVCKQQVPRDPAIREEVQQLLILNFNVLTRRLYNLIPNLQTEADVINARHIFDLSRDRVIKAFSKLNLHFVVPSVIGTILDVEELTSESESEEENMAITNLELARFINGTLKPFDGRPEELTSFVDALNVVIPIVPAEHADFALALVKSKLTGHARTLVTDQINTIQGIREVLRQNVRMNSSSFYVNKLKLAKQGGKDSAKYASELEELTNILSQAYISEGFTLANTQTLVRDALIESVKVNATNNTTQLAMQVGYFNSISDVLQKVVSQPKDNVNSVMFTRVNNNNRNDSRGNNRGRGRNNYNNNGRNNGNNNNNNGQNRNNNNYRGNNNYRSNQGNGRQNNQRRGNNQGYNPNRNRNYQNFYTEGHSENEQTPQTSHLGDM